MVLKVEIKVARARETVEQTGLALEVEPKMNWLFLVGFRNSQGIEIDQFDWCC